MRLAHFKQNVGKAEVAKTFLLLLLSGAFALANPEPPYSLVVVTLALCLPALGRKVLAGNPGFWSAVLARAALGLMVGAFLLDLVRTQLPGNSRLVTPVFGALALYSSAFFWLWSDPEVVRVDPSTED